MNKINKPRRLLVIGWGWLMYASFSLIDRVLGLSKIIGKDVLVQKLINTPSPELANRIELLTPIYHNLYTLNIFALFIFTTGIFAAIGFLRLKRWAYRLLEALTWLMVIIIPTCIVFAVRYSSARAADGDKWHRPYTAIIFFSFFCLLFLLTAWQLRSKPVREIFQK